MNWRVKLVMWLLKPYSHQVEWKPGSIPVIFADDNCLDFENLEGVPCWIIPTRRFGGRALRDLFYTVYAPDDDGPDPLVSNEPEKAV